MNIIIRPGRSVPQDHVEWLVARYGWRRMALAFLSHALTAKRIGLKPAPRPQLGKALMGASSPPPQAVSAARAKGERSLNPVCMKVASIVVVGWGCAFANAASLRDGLLARL